MTDENNQSDETKRPEPETPEHAGPEAGQTGGEKILRAGMRPPANRLTAPGRKPLFRN